MYALCLKKTSQLWFAITSTYSYTWTDFESVWQKCCWKSRPSNALFCTSVTSPS